MKKKTINAKIIKMSKYTTELNIGISFEKQSIENDSKDSQSIAQLEAVKKDWNDVSV